MDQQQKVQEALKKIERDLEVKTSDSTNMIDFLDGLKALREKYQCDFSVTWGDPEIIRIRICADQILFYGNNFNHRATFAWGKIKSICSCEENTDGREPPNSTFKRAVLSCLNAEYYTTKICSQND